MRQNLQLLVGGGRPASTAYHCIQHCWGATVNNALDVARSSLGITADGSLIYAAGKHLSVQALATAQIAAGAQRAMELDINPAWVGGYLYRHRAGRVSSTILVPGQWGIPGRFLTPYGRDFFAVLARP